ncbi:MAG TPA: outer membrane beta-barrel protein [Blastocatellia bacterium]|nr:outer membrane beta-barrel protein [Blastocatellia bacterium]
MRLILPIVFLLVALSTPALAQEPPPTEVFAGYSFVRPDGGGSLHGWNASVAVRLTRWVVIVGDFSGHYGSQSVRTEFINDPFPEPFIIDADSDSNMHTFLVGPKTAITFLGNDQVMPFMHLLFGASRLSADATIRFGNTILDTKFADISFAFAIGGGVDLKLSDSVGLRLIQADYLGTNFGGNSQANLRLSFGIVLH